MRHQKFAFALAVSCCSLPLVGCESMNHSASTNVSCCSVSAHDEKMDMSKMSKADMNKCGDNMLAKGNAMKADAMKMNAGAARDDAMKKADDMIRQGQDCKDKSMKM